MINVLLIAIPFLSGLVAFVIRNDYVRRVLIVLSSGFHLGATCLAWIDGTSSFFNNWLVIDEVGIIFLSITSLLFFAASVYGIQYLSESTRTKVKETGGSTYFSREAIFSGCFLLFLTAMTIVIASQHLAILWFGIEATTLASAPLIYYDRTKRSLEATWKYLLICSVGIAVALLGVFFLAVAGNIHGDMLLDAIVENAGSINTTWLKASFLMLFVGYGTKMGLAPFHTWLPDAHSEAPSIVSALLSGALLNCAFIGILRGYQICIAAGLKAFCQEIFIVFGLVSILFAAIFIIGQQDYKRMLAYSSVEHMGIITLGIGLGGAAVFGATVNMLGHSLTKAGLFFVAGNILSYFKSKKISEVKGLLAGRRWSGILWMTGFLIITGMPPTLVFWGKFIILKESLLQGQYWIAFAFLATLAVVFIGMARIYISMTQGELPEDVAHKYDYSQNIQWRNLAPAFLFIIAIVTGIYFPDFLMGALENAAHLLGGL